MYAPSYSQQTLAEANKMLGILSGWNQTAKTHADYLGMFVMRIANGETVTVEEAKAALIRVRLVPGLEEPYMEMHVGHVERDMVRWEKWHAELDAKIAAEREGR